MKIGRLRTVLATGLMLMGLPLAVTAQPIAPLPEPPLAQADTVLAQSSGLGCRQTNVSTGVYAQPNLDSASRGMLNRSQTIRLESKGDGWARINQPFVGWVQSRYLTPAVSCDPLNATSPIQTPPGGQITASPPPSPSPAPAIRPSTPPPQNASTAPIKATCDIVPEDGLVVRSEPLIDVRTYLTTIAPGTYEFEFTRETRLTPTETGDRRWVYITAPASGWITLGIEGRPANLGGRSCG